MRVLLSLFGVTCFGSIAGEYIIFSTKKNNIVEPLEDPRLYDRAYKVVMRYQWPTSTAYYHFMTPQEKHEYRASVQPVPVQSRQQAQWLVKTFETWPSREEEFIRQQLKTIDPHLDIAFVPGFVYELFILTQYLKDVNSGQSEESSLPVFGETQADRFEDLGDVLLNLVSSPHADIKDIFRLALEENEQLRVIRMHKRINNDLLEAVPKGLFGRTLPGRLDKNRLRGLLYVHTARAVDSLATEMKTLLRSPKLSASKYAHVFNFFLNPRNGLSQVASNALGLEKLSYKLNQALLWRVAQIPATYQVGEKALMPYEVTYLLDLPSDPRTGKLQKKAFFFKEFARLYNKKYQAMLKRGPRLSLREEDRRLQNLICQEQGFFNWKKPMRNISFGNSSLAGFVNDRCACIFFLASEKEEFNCAEPQWEYRGPRTDQETIGYIVRMDKIDYLVGKAGHLFRVAPFSTLLGIFGDSQIFHPISRAPYAGQHGDTIEITGINIDTMKHYLDYLAFPGDPLAFGAELAQYILRHSALFKVPDNQGGFTPSPGARERLQQDLKETAHIFKLLDVLYRFCVRRQERGYLALEEVSYALRELQLRSA